MPREQEFQRLLSLMFATRRLVRERILARGGAADPSAWLRLETLRFIDESDSPSMRELASYLRITAPSATSLVGTLLKAGLVARAYGKDRRIVRVRLTPKGKRELARTREQSARALKEVFSKLSKKERRALFTAFEKITAE